MRMMGWADGGDVEVDGIRLEIRRWPGEGGGLPILLLHEALGSVSMWRDYPARLAEATGREIVAWSRVGHGRSQPPAEARDGNYLDREAAAVLALMDALGLRRAHLYGHSDGTTIALLAAAIAPGQVAGLVLEAPHVVAEPMTLDGIAATLDAYRGGDLAGRLARHHGDAAHVFRSWHETWLGDNFQNWSIEDRLAAVAAPTLLIHGQDDRYFSARQLDVAEALLPAAERLELADCGHSPHRERPEAVLAAVKAFLDRLD